jgi:uncharacterized protein YbjT (DUF2867 family)
MVDQRKIILVTGATGQQGGAVARHLLNKQQFRVRAVTRDAKKTGAKILAMRGAEIVQADFNDPPSILRAMEGVHGVFSVQNFWEAGVDGEIRQGKFLADSAKAKNIGHFVYSSVASADKLTGLPHFDSKLEIEERIRRIQLPYTIFRPVFFMQNWRNYARDQILRGVLPQPLDPDRTLQQLSVDDIGAFVAMAFENPDKWIGRDLDLAGDELTMAQVAETFTRVMGRPVKYAQVPWDDFRKQAGEEMFKMYRWFNDVGYRVDIESVRKEYPALARLEQVLRAEDWSTATQRAA